MTRRRKVYTAVDRRMAEMAQDAAQALILAQRIDAAHDAAQAQYVWTDGTQAQTGAAFSLN